MDYLSYIQKCPCRSSESPGQGEGLAGESLCPHRALDTQEVYFWSTNQTAELDYVRRKKLKYLVTSLTHCSNNKQHMKEAVRNFLQQENPTSKALPKQNQKEYKQTKPCKMINGEREDAKGQEINRYLSLAFF